MSISRSGDNLTEDIVADVSSSYFAFDDYVQQLIVFSFELDFSAATGSDLPSDGNTISAAYIEEEILGNGNRIEDNQVAELVMIERTGGHFAKIAEGGEGTTNGTAWLEVELTDLDEETSEFDVQTGDIALNHGNIGDAAPADYTETSAYTRLDPATLDFVQAICGQGFKDPANGAGGGSSATSISPLQRNYRMNFGRGPIKEPRQRNTLSAKYSLQWDNWDNEKVGASVSWLLWWDLYEYEERTLREVTGSR